jgi:hypothetical protein
MRETLRGDPAFLMQRRVEKVDEVENSMEGCPTRESGANLMVVKNPEVQADLSAMAKLKKRERGCKFARIGSHHERKSLKEAKHPRRYRRAPG